MTWISDRNHIGWDIFCDDAACSDDRVIADRDTRHDFDVATKLYVFPDMDRFSLTSAIDSFCCINGMIGRI